MKIDVRDDCMYEDEEVDIYWAEGEYVHWKRNGSAFTLCIQGDESGEIWKHDIDNVILALEKLKEFD